jgi:hypothetical protein
MANRFGRILFYNRKQIKGLIFGLELSHEEKAHRHIDGGKRSSGKP